MQKNKSLLPEKELARYEVKIPIPFTSLSEVTPCIMLDQAGFSKEYPDRIDLPSVVDGKYKGVIGVGGLLLMRCPIEVKEDRDAYFRRLTDEQTASIENDLYKEEHPSMPISQERQNRVTFGGKKTNG